MFWDCVKPYVKALLFPLLPLLLQLQLLLLPPLVSHSPLFFAARGSENLANQG